MKKSVFEVASLFLLPLVLVGCASTTSKNEGPGPGAQNTGLNPQHARIADGPIFADRKAIESLQDRLRKLNEAGVLQSFYPLAKAQCWLDSAKTQYHENDRTGYIEESMSESQKIIQALEANKSAKVGFDTPHVARSTRLRDDLWEALSAFKSNAPTLACNARTVACAEVRLVRAGHAHEQTGWRAATPHVMMAEDGLRRAAQEAASCLSPVIAAASTIAPVAVTTPAVVVAPAAAPVPTPVIVEREVYVLLSDALFRFDKHAGDEMLSGGRERLVAIAQRLKSYKTIEKLTVIGHTDRVGSDAYNDPLSSSRAATVKRMLEDLGVKANQSESIGKGKREPVTTNCSGSDAKALIACLQPDRRVTIEVSGVVK